MLGHGGPVGKELQGWQRHTQAVERIYTYHLSKMLLDPQKWSLHQTQGYHQFKQDLSCAIHKTGNTSTNRSHAWHAVMSGPK